MQFMSFHWNLQLRKIGAGVYRWTAFFIMCRNQHIGCPSVHKIACARGSTQQQCVKNHHRCRRHHSKANNYQILSFFVQIGVLLWIAASGSGFFLFPSLLRFSLSLWESIHFFPHLCQRNCVDLSSAYISTEVPWFYIPLAFSKRHECSVCCVFCGFYPPLRYAFHSAIHYLKSVLKQLV